MFSKNIKHLKFMIQNKIDNDAYLNSETVVFHGDWLAAIANINDVELRLRFIEMILYYGSLGIEPIEEDININAPLWVLLKQEIDSDKLKRRERILRQREYKKKYKEKKKEIEGSFQNLPEIPANSYNLNSDNVNDNEHDTEYENDTESKHVSVNVHAGNSTKVALPYISNKISPSSSSLKKVEDEEGEDDFLSKEELKKINRCVKLGVEEQFAKEKFLHYRSLGFKLGTKEIGDIVALIKSRWEKETANAADMDRIKREKENNGHEPEENGLYLVSDEVKRKYETFISNYNGSDKDFKDALSIVSEKGKILIFKFPTKSTYDTYMNRNAEKLLLSSIKQLFRGYKCEISW